MGGMLYSYWFKLLFDIMSRHTIIHNLYGSFPLLLLPSGSHSSSPRVSNGTDRETLSSPAVHHHHLEACLRYACTSK